MCYVLRCYNQEVWSLKRIVISAWEAVKREPEHMKLKNFHC
jgi:hypothetical protein